jgi:hypothetical protein
MSQTIKGSTIETIANTAVGFAINYIANLCIFPLFGMHISMGNNFLMGLIYTLISIARGFALRRIFNNIRSHHVTH